MVKITGDTKEPIMNALSRGGRAGGDEVLDKAREVVGVVFHQ
jgi:hypothetical protein